MMSGVVTTVNVLMNLLIGVIIAVHSQQQRTPSYCTGEKDDVQPFRG